MGKINKVEKLTDCKHLNLYAVDATSVHNTPVSYYVASRAEEIENLKLRTKKNTPDGVIIYSLYGEKRDKVVLVRQYRYAIDDYIYEFPAGLVEKGRISMRRQKENFMRRQVLLFIRLKHRKCMRSRILLQLA